MLFYNMPTRPSSQSRLVHETAVSENKLTPFPDSGRTEILPATDTTLPSINAIFATNVYGPMLLCQAFMPLLVASRGLIINMASLAAVTPYVFSSVYCASKGALVSYSRTLRAEVRPLGVRVMVAMAGQVASQLSTRLGDMQLPDGSFYKPVEDIYAQRLAFSQKKRKMPAVVFVKGLVDRALAPETPAWLRSWVGRPDYFWGGGNSTKVWWGLALGEWIIEAVMYRMFGMPKIERILQSLGSKKLK
jgi:1-acylglycerone phosphate reductase